MKNNKKELILKYYTNNNDIIETAKDYTNINDILFYIEYNAIKLHQVHNKVIQFRMNSLCKKENDQEILIKYGDDTPMTHVDVDNTNDIKIEDYEIKISVKPKRLGDALETQSQDSLEIYSQPNFGKKEKSKINHNKNNSISKNSKIKRDKKFKGNIQTDEFNFDDFIMDNYENNQDYNVKTADYSKSKDKVSSNLYPSMLKEYSIEGNHHHDQKTNNNMKRNCKKKKIYSSDDNSDIEINAEVKKIARAITQPKKKKHLDILLNDDSDVEFVVDKNTVKQNAKKLDDYRQGNIQRSKQKEKEKIENVSDIEINNYLGNLKNKYIENNKINNFSDKILNKVKEKSNANNNSGIKKDSLLDVEKYFKESKQSNSIKDNYENPKHDYLKPDAQIYENTMERLGLKRKRDDNDEVIKFKTIKYKVNRPELEKKSNGYEASYVEPFKESESVKKDYLNIQD